MPAWPSDRDGHRAEEARLAFVAMTRAGRRLYMTFADAYLRQAGRSVFLDMAAPEAEDRELTRASSHLEPGDVLLPREAEVLLASHPSALGEAVLARAQGFGPDLDFPTHPQSRAPFAPHGPRPTPHRLPLVPLP